VAEQGGVTGLIARVVGPLFRRLFPAIPPGHAASGAIVMNRSANMLGLDNAATPLGLKAMKELQSLNRTPDTASDEMVLFMVMNASSVTLVPISIMTFRQQLGAANPADVFVPILIATYISDIVGLMLVASVQRIPLLSPVVLGWVGGLTALMGGLVWHFTRLPADQVAVQSALLANAVLIGIVGTFLVAGLTRKVPVYETFVEGAKEGFQTAVGIIPYLVAMLVAVGALRASGVLDALLDAIRTGAAGMALDTRWVDGLPTALIKPFSGGGARGVMVETMKTLGADSFGGRLACIIQGSTETTFYVLAVYFGSVGIKKTRHALPCALGAEVAGVLAAILVTYVFFG
jgi:spore maturation protein SpmB